MKKNLSIFFILLFTILFTTSAAEALTLRWKSIPIRVCVPENQYAPLMKKAFAEWTKVSGGKVKFTYNCADPQITISYAKNKQKSLTTYSYNSQGYLLKAHIEMGLLTKQGKVADDEILVLLMEHEIAHALGIAGHTNTPKSIMRPTVEKGYTITPDTIAEINKLYK